MIGHNRANQRRTPIGQVALLCALCSVCLLAACGGKEIAKARTESDAVEIVSVLTEHNFDADKEEITGGETRQWQIIVREMTWFTGDDAARSIQVLNYYGLPRREDQEGAGDSGLALPDPQVERAKQLKELERKIEKQVRLLPGVVRVQTSIVLPEDDDIKINPYNASASVTIVHREEKARFSHDDVRSQVAGSVPNLQKEKINVTSVHEPPPPFPREDLSLRRRRNLVINVVITTLTSLLLLLFGLLFWQRYRQKAQLAAQTEPEDLSGTETETTSAQLIGDGAGARGATSSRSPGKGEAASGSQIG